MNNKFSKIVLGTFMVASVTVPFSHVLATAPENNLVAGQTPVTVQKDERQLKEMKTLLVEENTDAVDNTVADVNDEAGITEALKNAQIKTINIKKDIEIENTITVEKRDVAINGNGHKISKKGGIKAGWQSAYIIHVFHSTVTIENVILSDGDAGLSVNGSNVTLKGNINVSNNEFGGIEVTNGSTKTTPSIKFDNVTFTNTTEKYGMPTLWTDPEEGLKEVKIEHKQLIAEIQKDKGNYKQRQFYLEKANSIPNSADDVLNSIDNSEKEIKIDATTTNDTISTTNLEKLKKGTARDITITSSGVTLTFNSKNIVDTTKPLAVGIEVKKDLAVKDTLKEAVKGKNVLYIDLKHEGVLPKGTTIKFPVNDQYKAGDVLFLYYFNPQTNKAELVSKDVKVDSTGNTLVTIDHASTYFLSDKELASAEKPTDVKNPNTSDFTALLVSALGLAGLGGLGIASKKNKKQN